MKKFSTFIFDVDGTLAHTNKLIFESFRHVAKKFLGRTLTDEEIIELFGPTEDVILREWMKDKYDTARKDYFDFYTSEHQNMVKSFNGLDEILELLKASNKNLAVFTGKGKDSTRITLEKLNMNHYFDLIVTGDDVVKHKPSGEGIIKILEHFDENPENVLMIGDSPHDITASKETGVPIAAVIWDSYAAKDIPSLDPDYILNTPQELHTFVQESL